MTTETKTAEKKDIKPAEGAGSSSAAPKEGAKQPRSGEQSRGGRGGAFKKRASKKRESRKRFEREKPEFEQQIIDIRRVTRVVKGGRRFSFSVSLIAGDRNGRVGVGTGKAGDTAQAIEKAFKNAKKNMVTLKRTEEGSIPHEVEAKYNSARILVMPAPGRGLVAGSSARILLELAGINDTGAKIFSRSKNKLNIARGTLKALKKIDKV